MKKSRFATLFVCAATLGAFSAGTSFAQPAPPTTKTGKGKGAKGMRGASKKMIGAIEAKLGKPLSADQKTQLGKAVKTRLEATKAAQDKFLEDAAAATGLSVEALQEIVKPAGRGGKAPKAA